MKIHLAVDLGASSGRVMAGSLDDSGQLLLVEVHRFPNRFDEEGGRFSWDSDGLFTEIKRGLSLAGERYGADIVSIGVDTWGVDYGLLDAQGKLLARPIAYRDPRTEGMEEEAVRRFSREGIYEATGIQFMFFNTLNQLLSAAIDGNQDLGAAQQLLFMPDLIAYWLCGRAVNERSIASTSQCLDPRTGTWATDMLEKVGIPTHFLGEIVEAGTPLAPLSPEIAEELGLAPEVQVVAVGAHDTASAVAAVPYEDSGNAYLSSGTWSLMGIESPKPIISPKSFELGFTNEGGVGGSTRVLKNICGLWLVQECRRIWAEAGEELGFGELVELAATAPAFQAFIHPDATDFAAPADMVEAIREACRNSGQAVPEDKGAVLRVALESLAMRYREVFGMLEDLAGRRIDALHIVGGGTQNLLLNQFTADALGRPVITGPVEATALGNLLLQMQATGALESLADGRALIRNSFETETFTPQNSEAWTVAYDRYRTAMQD